jgi:hypothetical protein
MTASGSGTKNAHAFRLDQWMLAATGAVAFALGVTVHSKRDNLAMTLVGVGALLVVIAVLLPRLQTLSGKVGGVEWSVGLIPPPTVTDDRDLATATPNGLAPMDLRSAGAPASGSAGFADAINGGRAEVVVINLENGTAWLTSRLFVFVFVLMDLRGLYSLYVNQVSLPGAPVPAQAGEWIQRQDQMWERAAWMDPTLVRRLLLSSLFEQTVPESATPTAQPDRETPESAALAYKGVRFVPVVNDKRQYRSVVDRYAILDTLWHRRAL